MKTLKRSFFRGRSLLHFIENWKKVPRFWPSMGQISHSKYNFQVFLRGKTQNISFMTFFLCVFLLKCLSSCSNSKKTYLWIALQKNQFMDSLVEYCKKIMKMLNASIFSFTILTLVKKGILDFYVTTVADVCMKEVIESCPHRAL